MNKLLLLCILPLCSCASHSSNPATGLAAGGTVDMSLFPDMNTKTVPISESKKSGQVAIRKAITLPSN